MNLSRETKADLIGMMISARKVLKNSLNDLDFMRETEGWEHVGIAEARFRVLAALRFLGSDDPEHWPGKEYRGGEYRA